MDEERMRWITRPPSLDRLTLDIRYSAVPAGVLTHITAQGHCDRKRGALWTLNEERMIGVKDYDATDLIHHIALACGQARPNSEQSLHRAMTGGYWEQGEFPF